MSNAVRPPQETRGLGHTIGLPSKLWTALRRRAERWEVSDDEALRRAVWLLTEVADRLDKDERGELVFHHSDGTEEPFLLVPSSDKERDG